MAFNILKANLDQTQFTFLDTNIEISPLYTYFGVLFSRPKFSMQTTSLLRLQQGYAIVYILERQCIQLHFEDIPSKLELLYTLFIPIALFKVDIWGPILTNWIPVE